MPNSREMDTSRSEVKTYVPTYQKEIWRDHANRLDMSQSEFVRTMVQAGRRGFEVERDEPTPAEGSSSGSNPGGDSLEDRVRLALRENGVLGWDQLVAALTDDVEDRLESALDALQADDVVRYAGRQGGYTLTMGEHE